MAEINYENDRTGAAETARGSDNRLNTSARVDSRAYYNSRDVGRCFSLTFDHQSAAAGEYCVYWQNTSPNRTLVISDIETNAAENVRFKVSLVTGTGSGTSITPVQLNPSQPYAAEATCLQGPVSGLTEYGIIEFASVGSLERENIDLKDRLRLGQNDALAIEYDEGTTGDFWGTIFGYYEES
jgi:hypothetical protein